jgi:SulP family sulfate permease
MSPRAPEAVTPLFYRLFPAFDSLRRYRAEDARTDFLAGITVAAVAVPQAMAYAMIAGLPAEYGLYTAIVMTAVGAIFDSSRQLINGPTNAISIALLSAIAMIDGTDAKVQAAVLLAFMVGALQLGITLLRLGDLTRYISNSVIVGFTAGAGALLVLDQLKNFLGMKSAGGAHDHFLVRFWRTMTEGGGIHPETAAVSVGTLVFILTLRGLKRRLGMRLLPELLIAVAIAATAVAWLGLDQRGVSVVGEIPVKLPTFSPPVLDATAMRGFATSAFAIAVLGLLEAISMAKAIAAQTGQRLDMNQQCLSEGLANMSGSFFQCFPGSGSLTRSAINQQAGAATQWSGVVSAAAVAIIMLLLAPYARFIPRSALAAILMLAAWRMVDRRALVYHLRATRFDAAIVATTAIAAVAVSVEFCVLIGIFMSFMLAVPRAGRMLLTEFVIAPDGGVHERLPEDPLCDRLLIFGLEGELFFGATGNLEQYFRAIEERVSEKTRVLVLRMKRVRNPDAVGLTLLEGFVERVRARGVAVVLCGVRAELHEVMLKTGLAEKFGEKEIFLEQPVRLTSTLLAIRHAYTLLPDRCPTCPRRGQTMHEKSLYYSI